MKKRIKKKIKKHYLNDSIPIYQNNSLKFSAIISIVSFLIGSIMLFSSSNKISLSPGATPYNPNFGVLFVVIGIIASIFWFGNLKEK